MLNKIVELGISRTEALELIKVSEDIEKDYQKLVDGVPIQYLIGYVDFYGNKINVNKNVLIPRYETELLVDKTISLINEKFDSKVSILDLCTGSGCIGISLYKSVNCDVTISDVSIDALEVAKTNIFINDVNINCIHSDLFDNINGTFDVIISNPPYISNNIEVMDIVDKNEPDIALYAPDNGLYFYEKILSDCRKYLNNKFIIAFEIGYEQGESIKKIANKYFSDSKVIVEKDYSLKDRFLFIISE